MNVYVVIRGELSEGGSVVGVFSDIDAACEVALAQKRHFGAEWSPERAPLKWTNGCDFVQVEEHAVVTSRKDGGA